VWLGAATAVAVFAVAGCDDNPTVAPTTTIAVTTTTIAPRPDDGQLVLGALLPRTGPGAALGEPMIAAVQDAVTQINDSGGVLGKDVVLHVVDEGIGTGLSDLITLGVDAIVGPASSTVALAQLSAAVQPGTGVVTCSPTATAVALDNYPDNKLFFRTVPSDTMLMAAIARRAEATGVGSVSVGYLDDPYGRGLEAAFSTALEDRNRLELETSVGVKSDQEDLSASVAELLAGDPSVIIVLGDPDDGSRLLAGIDAATPVDDKPTVFVNDAVRDGRQTIQSLTPEFKEQLTVVAPVSTSAHPDAPAGFFSANAVDCVNLIALATVETNSDAPTRIQAHMAAVSVGGSVCMSFADCKARLEQGLRIDYSGMSGTVELSTTTGDLVRGTFATFGYDAEGNERAIEGGQFDVS
jgi:branched-chain amino acid transport system substrate-binding protein